MGHKHTKRQLLLFRNTQKEVDKCILVCENDHGRTPERTWVENTKNRRKLYCWLK
jgi:hypothetical protein